MRYLFYFQGARGLGRISRCRRICKILQKIDPEFTAIILTGEDIVFDYDFPENTEIVKLPSIVKLLEKNYRAKYLNISLREIIFLRTKIILGCVEGYRPDIFFVDTQPTGVLDELLEPINWLKDHCDKSQLVFLSRDILDSPAKIRKEWHKHNVYSTLENKYNKILIFGEACVFDFAQNYQFSDLLISKTYYCGYFPKQYILKVPDAETAPNCEIDLLVTVGGGIDGGNILTKVIDAVPFLSHLRKIVLVLGHQLPVNDRQVICDKAKQYSNVQLIGFTTDLPSILMRSSIIIAMAGYNTINELISLEKSAIIIPRATPTEEQHLRSKRMQDLGLIDVIENKNLCTTTLLSKISSFGKATPKKFDILLNRTIETRLKAALF